MKELANMIGNINTILQANGYSELVPPEAPAAAPEQPAPAEEPATPPAAEAPAQPSEPPAAVEPPQTPSDAPPEPTGLTEDRKREIAFLQGLRDDYVKVARKEDPSYTRMDARADYKRIRKEMIAEGKWKLRPNRNATAVTKPDEAPKAEEPATPPTAEATPPANVPTYVEAPGKPEEEEKTETPETVPPLQSPMHILEAIGNKAKGIIEASDKIKAIQYIREAASFQLLTAKMWVDVLAGDIPTIPIPLQQEMDAYTQKLLLENGASLNDQVQAVRQAQIEDEMNPAAGKAEGQLKAALAGDKNQGFVQIARTIARRLAATGPITIDHVTAEMGKLHNVMPEKGKRKHQWKGSVFTKAEWQYIGDVPSSQKSAHARPVGLWALKSWLKDNTLNGKSTHVSSFVLSRLYTDFQKTHPNVEAGQCNCFVGEERLSDEIRETIVAGENNIYGMPVTFCPGAVGAMIMPPNPAIVLATGAGAQTQQ